MHKIVIIVAQEVALLTFLLAWKGKYKYLCGVKKETMATITLKYNEHNAASRRMLNTMLSSGLFVNQETLEEHRRLRDAAVLTSQRNMAPFISKYL